nr:MAG TPA: hypothetical protein [Caudoviricetes sp.]
MSYIINLLIVFMQTNVMADYWCVNGLYVNSEACNSNSRYCV